ncbi:MAG: serine/threonine-protein kinase [Polyangiaceae bacterium]
MTDPNQGAKAIAEVPPEDEAYAARVGSVINGKWTLDALLGVGGMAAVFAATHRNGSRAALKILHAEFARDSGVCERFLREARVSNRIGHPACVQIKDDDTTEAGEPYLVMELLEGLTLRQLWKKRGKRVPVAEVLGIVDGVLDCLVACHAINVIHRDLKPANIFVTDRGETKVLDFGIAQMRSAQAEKTATGTALGTPSYMSPEQAMGLVDQLDGRADIFSVGAVMHALVSGVRIHKGRSESESLIMAATTPVPSVARLAPDIPVEVVALIDKALAWDRRSRFESARDMQNAVRAILGPQAMSRVMPTAAHVRDSIPDVAQKVAEPEPPPPPSASTTERAQRAEELRELFRHVDKLLPNVRQFGWNHPVTERALRTAFDAIHAHLEAKVEPLVVDLDPYSFSVGSDPVWEPAAPFDAVPYNLFSAGMRRLRIERGILADEFRGLLEILTVEPGRDLPPEDDIVTALWDRGFAHVRYDVTDAFAEGDAAEREAFYGASDEVEEIAKRAARVHASRLEAKALALATGRTPGADAADDSPFGFATAIRLGVEGRMAETDERWNDRYVDVLADALVESAHAGDMDRVLASLKRSAADLVVAGRFDVVLTLHATLTDRLSGAGGKGAGARIVAELTEGLFAGDVHELMMRELEVRPENLGLFQPVLDRMGPKAVPRVLAALVVSKSEAVQATFAAFAERHVVGNEVAIANAIAKLDTELATRMLAHLGRANTKEAKRAITTLTNAENPTVRLEAKILSALSPDALAAELSSHCEAGAAPVRMSAIRAIQRYNVKGAWPAVARHVRSALFGDVAPEERREFLRTLVTLSQERGEPVLLELVKKSGVLGTSTKDTSRISAMEILAEVSRSPEVVLALNEIAQSRWGVSDEVRAAAQRAATQVGSRIPHRGAGRGGEAGGR